MFVATPGPAPSATPQLAAPEAAPGSPAHGADLTAYRDPSFHFDVSTLMGTQRQLDGVRPDEHGIRWVHAPGVVAFLGTRDIAAGYDEFVERLDLTQVGRMLRGVQHSTTEVLRRDEHARVRLQLERVAVLAQPGHSAYMAQRAHDVHTLERVDYALDEVRIWMRTVHGRTTGGIGEDGYLAFRRGLGGDTRVALLTRQQFPMPSLLTLTGVERWRWLRNRMSVSAFHRFFHRTLSALETEYAEQRPSVAR